MNTLILISSRKLTMKLFSRFLFAVIFGISLVLGESLEDAQIQSRNNLILNIVDEMSTSRDVQCLTFYRGDK